MVEERAAMVVARAAAVKEKANRVVALMEAMKKEVVEPVPKFKASEAFVDEVLEAVLNS